MKRLVLLMVVLFLAVFSLLPTEVDARDLSGEWYVRWQGPPADLMGSKYISHYQLERYTETTTWSLCSANDGSTTYTILGGAAEWFDYYDQLPDGTNILGYRVRAVTAAGWTSEYTEPLVMAVPSSPIDLCATQTLTSSVDVEVLIEPDDSVEVSIKKRSR